MRYRHRIRLFRFRPTTHLSACISLLLVCAVAFADAGPVTVGAPAPDFGLRSIDPASGALSRMIWLSDFVGPKAKQPKRLVVLNFFAVWCHGCIQELPVLELLQQRYAEHGLQVLSVNVRRDQEPVDEALRKSAAISAEHKLTFPVLFDRYTLRNQLSYVGESSLLPCNVFIDASGVVVRRIQGADARPEQLEAVTRELLGIKGTP